MYVVEKTSRFHRHRHHRNRHHHHIKILMTCDAGMVLYDFQRQRDGGKRFPGPHDTTVADAGRDTGGGDQCRRRRLPGPA